MIKHDKKWCKNSKLQHFYVLATELIFWVRVPADAPIKKIRNGRLQTFETSKKSRNLFSIFFKKFSRLNKFINTSSSRVDARFKKFAPITFNLIDKKTLIMYNQAMKTKNQQQQNF